MSTEPAEAAADTPRGQLDALFVQLEAMIRMPEFRGCPFANAAAELADLDHPAHRVVRRHKERLRRWMLVRAKQAGAAEPEALTRQLMLVYAGAQSQALVERSPRPARDAQALAGQLLDAATGAYVACARAIACANDSGVNAKSQPASGSPVIADASMVSATRSSGSRLWTCDLPQARASVCASSVSTLR